MFDGVQRVHGSGRIEIWLIPRWGPYHARGAENAELRTHTYIYIYIYIYMGGCQNYGPFLGPYYNTAPNI